MLEGGFVNPFNNKKNSTTSLWSLQRQGRKAKLAFQRYRTPENPVAPKSLGIGFLHRNVKTFRVSSNNVKIYRMNCLWNFPYRNVKIFRVSIEN